MIDEELVVEQTGTPPAQPGEPCQRCGWEVGRVADIQLCCVRHPNPLCGRCRRVVHFDDRRKNDA